MKPVKITLDAFPDLSDAERALQVMILVDKLSLGSRKSAQIALSKVPGVRVIGPVIQPPGNGGRSALLASGDQVLAIFRGSSDRRRAALLANVLSDLDANPAPFPDTFKRLDFAVHDGTLDHASPHMAVMRERLRGERGLSSMELTCGGFSLGGMAAQVSAAWFARAGGFSKVRCTALGCARIFTHRASSRYKRLVPDTQIYALAADPIPRIPGGGIYRHVRRPVRLKKVRGTGFPHSRPAYISALNELVKTESED